MEKLKNPILFVEDDSLTGRMMEAQLSRKGFQVTWVQSGQAALKHLEENKCGLVLSDMIMPEMDGLQLLEEIRRLYSKSELPVIMMTASDEEDDIKRALDLGANDFIPKTNPFFLTLLRLNIHLDKSPATSDPRSCPRATMSSPDALWNWDITKNTLHFSPQWKQLLGFQANQIGSSPDSWLQRVHEDDRAELEKRIHSHWNKEQTCFQMDYRIQNKDGNYIWVHSFGVCLFGKGGQPFRMLGSMCRIDGPTQPMP